MCRSNSSLISFVIKHIIPLLLFILILITEAGANPFLGESVKSRPAASPVVSGGSGPFIDIQFNYRDKVASLFREMKTGKEGPWIIILLGASFLYGLFHAAGPGHRKTVMFSIFLSRKTKWYEPLTAGFLSAGIHAGTSLLIILLLWVLQKSVISLSDTDLAYRYMEVGTYLLLLALAIFLIISKVKSFIPGKRDSAGEFSRGIYLLIIISSLVPCPGATMVLILSIYLDLAPAGVISVIAMSFGMGIIISASGYLAFAGREGIFYRLKKNEAFLKRLSGTFEIVSYLMILMFSAYMLLPFFLSIIM